MQYQFVKQVLEESDFDALASLSLFEAHGHQYVSMAFRLNPRKTYGPLDARPDSIYLTDGASPRRLYVTGELDVPMEAPMEISQEAPAMTPVEDTPVSAAEETPAAPEPETAPEPASDTASEPDAQAPAEEAPTSVGLSDDAGGATA